MAQQLAPSGQSSCSIFILSPDTIQVQRPRQTTLAP